MVCSGGLVDELVDHLRRRVVRVVAAALGRVDLERQGRLNLVAECLEGVQDLLSRTDQADVVGVAHGLALAGLQGGVGFDDGGLKRQGEEQGPQCVKPKSPPPESVPAFSFSSPRRRPGVARLGARCARSA